VKSPPSVADECSARSSLSYVHRGHLGTPPPFPDFFFLPRNNLFLSPSFFTVCLPFFFCSLRLTSGQPYSPLSQFPIYPRHRASPNHSRSVVDSHFSPEPSPSWLKTGKTESQSPREYHLPGEKPLFSCFLTVDRAFLPLVTMLPAPASLGFFFFVLGPDCFFSSGIFLSNFKLSPHSFLSGRGTSPFPFPPEAR